MSNFREFLLKNSDGMLILVNMDRVTEIRGSGGDDGCCTVFFDYIDSNEKNRPCRQNKRSR